MQSLYRNPYMNRPASVLYNNPYAQQQESDDVEIVISDSPQKDRPMTRSDQKSKPSKEIEEQDDDIMIIDDNQNEMNNSHISVQYQAPQMEEENANQYEQNHSNNMYHSNYHSNLHHQTRINQEDLNRIYNSRHGIPTLTNKTRTKVIDAPVLGDHVDIHNASHQDGRVSLRNDNDDHQRNNQMNGQLIDELTRIEQHQNYKGTIEKFILKFSNNPKDGIQYLIDSGLCQDDDGEIARMLLITEGLSRDALNKYFGAPKEKNQSIFKAYCSLMDFKGISFVKALRLLLSRFRMAGEAQQVDRMVQIFAEVYHNDNPTVFDSAETPYLMAYSLIMLSTDAASTKIPQRNKMTKPQFIHNNRPVFPKYSDEFFEEIYDDIVREPFQTTIDYMERIYNRMTMCHEKLQGQALSDALKLAFDLMKGSNLIKYGRRGPPQTRKMFLSSDEKRICWHAIDKEENARYINVQEVQDLALGCVNTTDLMRMHNVPAEFDAFCFSIITPYRTLDLKVNDVEIKSKWVNYLRAIILQRREHECRRAQNSLRRQENQKNREEIWRTDIFPRWEYHWDYKKNRPQNFQKYQSVRKEETIQKQQDKANRGPSILSQFCSCLKNTIPIVRAHERPAQPQQPDSNIQMYQQQEQMAFQGKNQSLLLMILWKLGVPDWARKTLWPISIGNRLEFTEQLYHIHLSQVQMAKKNLAHTDKWIRQAFNKIEDDLKELMEHQHYATLAMQLTEEKLKSLSNVLHSFVFYRPDFGYIQGMSFLAAVLVLYMNEYETAQSFINLVHQYHFLPLFKGDMREVEWRVRFFDENLQRVLPLVFNHFKALDLSSEIFLIQWFMRLFSNNFPIEMSARLWDNFLLEGEIYVFKVAIAYLKYFQLELKMSPFDEVVQILKNDPPEINEDYFFIMVDEIPIKEEEYKRFIEQQKIALLNTQIHVALLEQ